MTENDTQNFNEPEEEQASPKEDVVSRFLSSYPFGSAILKRIKEDPILQESVERLNEMNAQISESLSENPNLRGVVARHVASKAALIVLHRMLLRREIFPRTAVNFVFKLIYAAMMIDLMSYASSPLIVARVRESYREITKEILGLSLKRVRSPREIEIIVEEIVQEYEQAIYEVSRSDDKEGGDVDDDEQEVRIGNRWATKMLFTRIVDRVAQEYLASFLSVDYPGDVDPKRV